MDTDGANSGVTSLFSLHILNSWMQYLGSVQDSSLISHSLSPCTFLPFLRLA